MKIKSFFILFSTLISSYSFAQKEKSVKTKEADFKTVAIGPQKWMAENLNTDHFVNGEKIPEVKSLEEWKNANNEKRPAWCYYNFDTLNSKTFGKLYNWYAVNDPRGLAPKGWKIPSIEDWRLLEKSVNSKYPYSTSTELLLMSNSNWKGNGAGMGISGFNAQPSGYIESGFKELGEIAFYWSNNIDDIIFLRDDSYYQFHSKDTFDVNWSFIDRIEFKTIQSGSCHDGFEGDGFAVRCVKNEIVPIIGEGKVQLENKYFEGMSYVDTIPVRRFTHDVILSDKDSTYFFDNDLGLQKTIEPFYVSDHEVTNGEYREFVNWVRDSIARVKIFQRINSDKKSEWVKFVQYNSGKKDNDGKYYVLNWEKILDYSNPMLMPILSDMYESNERFYKRRELDVRMLFFDYYDEDGYKNRINVYPDTSLWQKEIHLGGNSIQLNYFWFEEYKNFPVVGLTFEQAKAYCIWRTMMYHFEVGRVSNDKYDPSLKFRLPNEEEWERAAMGYEFPEKMKREGYRSNKKGRTHPFWLRPILNGYQTNENGYYQANFGPSYLNSGIYAKDFMNDGASYLCKVKSYDPNFNGLYCIYGNAAEWVNTKPELGDFYKVYLRYFQRNEPFRSRDTSKLVQVYITDPYTDSTFLIEKNSENHKNLIQKRLDFYQVSAQDSFEEVKKKFLALNSIDESYKSKIYELNNPKKSIAKDSIKLEKGPKDVIDGVLLLEEIPSRRNDYVKIYNISSGEYDYIEAKEPYDFYTRELYPAFIKFKQNASALKRAENPFNRNYPNSNLQENCRLVKGGSWYDQPHYLLLNNSQVYYKDEASCRIGFRIAADAIGNEMNKYDKKRIKKQRELLNQNSKPSKIKRKR